MTDEESRRIAEIKPHKGERLPAGRDVRAGELRALVEACARDRSNAGARDAAILAVLYIYAAASRYAAWTCEAS